MNIRPSTDRLPSEDLKQAQLRFDLLMEDFEKARSLLGQLERFISMPLDFNTLHRKTTSLIDGLRMVTERAIENYHYLAENLDDIYEQNVELENAISETHESINARFTFWLHSFWTGDASEGEVSRNVPTFSEFIQSLAEKESPYAYFLAPCGVTHMLICQSIPLESNPEALELHFSTYVDSPDGILQILQRAWNKLFRRPDRMLFHLFHRSRPQSSIGTFKQRSSAVISPYLPYRHNSVNQLPKIIYDFINVYGISGRHHVHLLKHGDRSALFLTQGPIRFDGRFVDVSDDEAADKLPKGTYRAMIE